MYFGTYLNVGQSQGGVAAIKVELVLVYLNVYLSFTVQVLDGVLNKQCFIS